MCPYTLQWFAPFRPQNCPLPWGSEPNLIREPWARGVIMRNLVNTN